MARPFMFYAQAKWWRRNPEPAGQHDAVELKTGN